MYVLALRSVHERDASGCLSVTRTHAGSSARVTLSQAASLLSCGVDGRETGRSIDRTVTRSMRATLQPSQRTGRLSSSSSSSSSSTPAAFAGQSRDTRATHEHCEQWMV